MGLDKDNWSSLVKTTKRKPPYKSRKAWAAALSLLIILFNRRLGLNLTTEEIAAAVLIITSLIGSWAYQNVKLS